MKELMDNGDEEEVLDLQTPGRWSAEAVDFVDSAMTVPAKDLAEVSHRA